MFEEVIGESGNNMDVPVEDYLSCGGFVVDAYVDAICFLTKRYGYFLNSVHDFVKECG